MPFGNHTYERRSWELHGGIVYSVLVGLVKRCLKIQ